MIMINTMHERLMRSKIRYTTKYFLYSVIISYVCNKTWMEPFDRHPLLGPLFADAIQYTGIDFFQLPSIASFESVDWNNSDLAAVATERLYRYSRCDGRNLEVQLRYS